MKVDLSKFQNPHRNKFRRLLWEIIWGALARVTPRWALNGWRRFLLTLFGAELGSGVRVQGSASIWQPWRLKIGRGSWIDGGVKLYSVDEIRIGENVVISEGAFLCTASHDIASRNFALITASIKVCDMAWIGSRAIVLPGVTIGEGAVVGAGAVVAKDVAPWTVVVGNPAGPIKTRLLI